MQKQNLAASGRIIIDDFHERFFLFVHASTHLTMGGETVPASRLPATDPEFARRLLEGIGLDGRAVPAGFSSNPSALSGFRIIRLLDEQAIPENIRRGLTGPGDRSRAVTISGHIATDKERGGQDRLTDPTITFDKVVTFEAIQQRAFDISHSGAGGPAIDNWLRAERALLTIGATP